MKMLNATLYQGIKPVGQPVTVWLEEGQLKIVDDLHQVQEDLFWPLGQIHPDPAPGDQKFIISFGKGSQRAYLEFGDREALRILQSHYPHKTWEEKGSVISKHGLGLALSAVFLLLALVLGVYFWLLPKIADQLALKVPTEWELNLGKQLETGMVQPGSIDSLKSAQLDSFFRMMDIPTSYPIRIYFHQDTIVNAFAMPGGTIVVYKGLFDKLRDYEALAGLLGHEFAHIEKRHSLRSMFRSLSGYLILSALFGDLTGITGLLLENAHSIQNLSYSRAFEHEADARAIELMLERKIGLSGMYGLFKIFMDEAPKGLEVPEFMRTHPVTADRMEFVEKQMGQKEGQSIERRDLSGMFERMRKHQHAE